MFVGETGESDYFYMYEKKDGKMTEKEVKIKDDFEAAVRKMLEEEDDWNWKKKDNNELLRNKI